MAGALLTAAFSSAAVAQNTGNSDSMERQKAQPLSLKIQRDESLRTPHRGEAMDSVKQRFGMPEGIRGPVGEPPITRWQYAQFTVVFEDDRVIHTVVEPDADG